MSSATSTRRSDRSDTLLLSDIELPHKIDTKDPERVQDIDHAPSTATWHSNADQIVTGDGRSVPVRGSFADVAAALGVEFGRPALDYPDGSWAQTGDQIVLDPTQLHRLLDWFARSAAALRMLAPDQEPILWPEHFDVAVLIDNRAYGSSPGDDHYPGPYAYVSAPGHDQDEFFNASFGALRDADELPTIADLLTFWHEGRRRLTDPDALAVLRLLRSHEGAAQDPAVRTAAGRPRGHGVEFSTDGVRSTWSWTHGRTV